MAQQNLTHNRQPQARSFAGAVLLVKTLKGQMSCLRVQGCTLIADIDRALVSLWVMQMQADRAFAMCQGIVQCVDNGFGQIGLAGLNSIERTIIVKLDLSIGLLEKRP